MNYFDTFKQEEREVRRKRCNYVMQKKNSKEIVRMLATASRFDAPKEKYKPIHFSGYHDVEDINPLLRNVAKRSDTLKILQQILEDF